MRKSEMLSVKIGEEIENSHTSLEEYEQDKIARLKHRLQEKYKHKRRKK
jgi:hypothetical protein